MHEDIWENCYPSRWNGLLVPEAMSHPAKVSTKLANRIFEHIVRNQWVYQFTDKRSIVLDPFAGIGGFAYFANLWHLNFLGIEVEKKFAILANQNIELWDSMRTANESSSEILTGDSRHLESIIGKVCPEVVVSSPPYSEARIGQVSGQEHCGRNDAYRESSKNNLGNMPSGNIEIVVSSPPYAKTLQTGNDKPRERDRQHRINIGRNPDSPGSFNIHDYGNTEGQLGQETESTFWDSSKTILEQVYKVLPTGGHCVWVTKRYVKNKEIVEFSNQWRLLCEHVGFRTLHVHKAMLVKSHGKQYNIYGGIEERKTESKSFFRRLAERQGSPKIDWEDVTCMIKD